MLSLRILAIESLRLGLKASRQKALYSEYFYYTLKSNKNLYLFRIVSTIIFVYDTIARRKDFLEYCILLYRIIRHARYFSCHFPFKVIANYKKEKIKHEYSRDNRQGYSIPF